MKALSLKQHWLYAITDLDKRIENRSWPPPAHIIGKRIALHASKTIDKNSKAEIFRISGLTVPDDTPRGSIVGTAVIGGYHSAGGWADRWFFGDYGWILQDVTKLREPIPCKGALSLWQVPDDIEAVVLKHLADRKTALRPGTQIVYVPGHAEGDAKHPDCEEGFVTSMGTKGDAAFCRYWSRESPKELRTRANSELTPLDNIVLSETHAQSLVDMWIRILSEEMGI